MLYVCSIDDMPLCAEELEPSHLVSLVEPDQQPRTPDCFPVERHLRIAIHDIVLPAPGQILPEAAHIETLLGYVGAWDAHRPLLLHCVAGISRSMAAALITLVARAPGQEQQAAAMVRAAAPHAAPNRRMVSLADRLLGCEGRLIAAREAMGPNNGLMTAGPVVELPLLDR